MAYKPSRLRIAVHEAGHAIVAEALAPGCLEHIHVLSYERRHVEGEVAAKKDSVTMNDMQYVAMGGLAADIMHDMYYGDNVISYSGDLSFFKIDSYDIMSDITQIPVLKKFLDVAQSIILENTDVYEELVLHLYTQKDKSKFLRADVEKILDRVKPNIINKKKKKSSKKKKPKKKTKSKK